MLDYRPNHACLGHHGAMTYPQAAPPPRIPASELRPSRVWYWVAGGIAVLGMCIGGVLGALGFASVVRDMPTSMDAEFDPGSPVTVDLSADKTWAIYVSREQGGGSIGTECVGSPENGGTIELNRSDFNFQFDSGGRSWRHAYDVEVSETGRYQIECRVRDAAATDARFGIAESITNVSGLAGRAFGSLGALLGIPCLALTAAGIIAVVTAVRRNSHKRRLQQERGYPPPVQPAMGYPGPGQPPPPGYQPPTAGYPQPPPGPPQHPPESSPSSSFPQPPPPPPASPPAPGPQPPPTTQE
jgi:hypothetical protein